MEKIPNIDFNADIAHASSYRNTWKSKLYVGVQEFLIVNNTH